MFRLLWLVIASALIDVVGLAAMFLTDWPSVAFMLSQRAIDLGSGGLLLSLFLYRRRSIESAYEIGIEVGVRRGRKAARHGLASVVLLPQDGAKQAAALPMYLGSDRDSL